jgi:hypothetical protein
VALAFFGTVGGTRTGTGDALVAVIEASTKLTLVFIGENGNAAANEDKLAEWGSGKEDKQSCLARR